MKNLLLALILSIASLLSATLTKADDSSNPTAVPTTGAIASSSGLSSSQQTQIQQTLAQTTFNNIAPISSSVNYQYQSQVPQIPSYSAKAGTPFSQAYPAALVGLMGGLNYSPQTATLAGGGDPNNLAQQNLSSMPFLGKTSLQSVVAANPSIAHSKVSSVFPSWQGNGSNTTLSQLVASDAGKSPIPTAVLSQTPIANIPSVMTTNYSAYSGLTGQNSKVKIADLPGIGNMSLSNFVNIGNPTNDLVAMKVSKINSGQKLLSLQKQGDKVAAGSYITPNPECTNCNAVELNSTTDTFNNNNPLNGTLSPTGLKLPGGVGTWGKLLSVGLPEPAGFDVPYIGIGNCGSKWSAESPNPQAGTFQQQLNFRICWNDPIFGFQATSYFIPVQIASASEADANTLLPMKVNPVANRNGSATNGTVASTATSAAASSAPSTAPSTAPSNSVATAATSTANAASPGTTAASTPAPPVSTTDKVALFGSATIRSYSPVAGIGTDNLATRLLGEGERGKGKG